MESTSEQRKTIIEFLGYKLANCNNGHAWESPHRYAIEDVLGLHGVLLESSLRKANFDTSWEKLMPVVHKCLGICHEKMLKEWENSFADKFLSCSISSMHKEVVEFIEWWKLNKDF